VAAELAALQRHWLAGFEGVEQCAAPRRQRFVITNRAKTRAVAALRMMAAHQPRIDARTRTTLPIEQRRIQALDDKPARSGVPTYRQPRHSAPFRRPTATSTHAAPCCV
jgi:hypothetical protein